MRKPSYGGSRSVTDDFLDRDHRRTTLPLQLGGRRASSTCRPVNENRRVEQSRICTPRLACWSKMRHMRRQLERCGDCSPAARCANHEACATHRDAALASEIGEAWAVFVRGQVDLRKPWP